MLALILSSTLFAQQAPVDVPPSKAAADSDSLRREVIVDSLAAVEHQLRSSQRIDSIRNALAGRRQFKDHSRRPSLRSGYDNLLQDTTTLTDSVVARLDSISSIIEQLDSADRADNIASLDTIADTAPADRIKPVIVDSLAADSLRPTTNPTKKAPKHGRIVWEKVDIEAPVDFVAKDSLVMVGQNSAFMYGNANVKYQDIDLAADEMQMDMNTSTIYAVGRPDSIGEIQGTPVFKDKSGDYESKTMKYNFKTGRGYITDVVTQQGEGYLTGGQTKKMEDNTYYMENGKYTTCDDHEHPHFYMQLTKAKVTPRKNVVSGPAYMVLCDVPLPLALPFGYFPFSSKYSSGVIMPTFGDDYQKGFYLSDGGYYFAINDYVDLALTGEIYTKGSWGLAAQSSYRKRYKYSGNFNISYLNTVTGDKGDPDYTKQKNFRLTWSHSQDAKANPKMTLSASVNFATSGYSRNDINSYYNQSFTENTKNSTVNMSYRFSSKFQMSTTASITQRTQDSTLAVSFPNITLSLSQVAPFKRKRAVGAERWYEKIKMSYTGTFQNSLTSKQNEFFKKSLIKDWSNGMRHSVPVSATFTMFKYFNVSPSISMNDRMYSSKVRRSWDPNASAEVLDTIYGFYNVFDFNASLTFDTKIYGFYTPLKFLGDKIKMIRSVMSPSVSFSASPDFSKPFWGYYGSYNYKDAAGNLINKKYNHFSNGIFGSVGEGKSGMVSVSLSNNLEMKVKSDKDSTGMKKISLIENFTISQSYNFAADSMRWSNINTSLALRLVKNFNLNLSATWDPYTYQLSPSGTPVRVDRTRLQAHKGWAKLSSTGTSFSYTFNNDTFKKKKDDSKNKDDKNADPNAALPPDDGIDGIDDHNPDGSEKKKGSELDLDEDGYVKWKFPWSLTLNYSVNYGYGEFDKKKMEYKGKLTQNLSFNGRIQPTKNWNFSFSASYNFDTHKLAYMNCNISRDLHCFTMTASFVPVGPYKSYNFHIAVKSSLLRDLKYDKRSSTTNGIDWY